MDSLDDRVELARRRLVAANEARGSLLRFAQLMMPDPDDMENPDATQFETAAVHQKVALETQGCIETPGGRLILVMPPRHGKTQIVSRSSIPWFVGNNPQLSTIFGTYNETFAKSIGREVREIIMRPTYRQVFPDVGLAADQKSAGQLKLLAGSSSAGLMAFTGRGGTVTGMGADGLFLDDPIKNAEEAASQLIRDSLWEWFNRVISTRLMTDKAFIILVQTRWHEDDLVGRLTDPNNPKYLKAEAKKWRVIDLPALAEDEDPLGREPGAALWPERFSVGWLKDQQRRDPDGFSALYQGRPANVDGAFFTQSMIHEYDPATEMPDLSKCSIYAAADLAVATKTSNDKTAIIPAAVDQHDNIFILPSVIWKRMKSDVAVEQIIQMIRTTKPVTLYSEAGQISHAIGPFLRKRIQEEGLVCSLQEIAPRTDKVARSQAIMQRMSFGKVFFPKTAHWFPQAKQELLKFPKGSRDDFVDALAYLGLALTSLTTGEAPDRLQKIRPGSFAEMFARSNAQRQQQRLKEEWRGWGV